MARLSALAVLLSALCAHVAAVSPSSSEKTPFLLWSGKTIPTPDTSAVSSRAQLRDLVTGAGCAKVNIVFEQADLHPLSLKQTQATTHRLRRSLADAPTTAKVFFVPAAESLDDVVAGLKDACGASAAVSYYSNDAKFEAASQPRILRVALDAPSVHSDAPDATIARTLAAVNAVVGDDWTAVLSGVQTPGFSHTVQKRATASTSLLPYSKRSLFQKYVFFSPGLFMCIFAMLPLVIVALLGVRMLMTIQTPSRFEVKKKEK
ncbi:hypothetical protein BDZ88DRAFT_187526 [Geranomyces variabilis]|nr:hypothetical protein BDZ88DRAFT_187526 [Geranomyces variabilis]KAJ3135494.1 hypothetical protein HDU90_003897 [Geranomyces variabilis]